MAIIPPDNYVEWATDPGAEKTDPGQTKTEDGWDVGDAPASSHFNYVAHSAAGFASFLPRAIPSTIAFGNIEYEVNAPLPWGLTNPSVFHTHFIRGRWYVLLVSSANSVSIYDSNDGETWTSRVGVDLCPVDTDITRPLVSSGGILAFGNDNRWFMSTDSTVENLQDGTLTPWAEILKIREAVYDNVSNLWVACGTDGANGKIETSPDGVTWTVRDSRGGDEYESIAVSPNGVFLATTDSGATTRRSTDGINWLAGPIFTNPVHRVVWSDVVGKFLAKDSLGNLFRIDESSTSEVDTLYNTSVLWLTPEFVWNLDPVTSAFDAFETFEGTYGNHQELGFMHIGHPVGFRYGEIVGGNGRVMYPYVAADGTSERAIAYYGAKNNAG